MSNSLMAICKCKNNNETKLVIAVKQGVFDLGFFALIINFILIAVTVGAWTPILVGWVIARYFSPTYNCQFCNSEINKKQFRSGHQQTQIINQQLANSVKQTNDLKLLDEQKQREQQKNYKLFLFNKSEFIDKIEKINDKFLQKYYLNMYFEKLKLELLSCSDSVEEINDKIFAKNTLERLNLLKISTSIIDNDYSNSSLSKIDMLQADLKDTEKKIKNFGDYKIDNTKIKIDKKIRAFRLFFITVLGFINFIWLGIGIDLIRGKSTPAGVIIFFVITLLIFVVLLIKERIWIKNYDTYKSEQEHKQIEQVRNNEQIEKNHKEEFSRLQKHLLEHPALIQMEEVFIKHSDFIIIANELSHYTN